MVQVIGVHLINIGVIEEVKLELEGQCLSLIADTRKGKSTIQNAIKSNLGIIDFRKDSLRKGTTEGSQTIFLKDYVTDKRYSIDRRYSKGKLQRFVMKCLDNNEPLQWENEIRQLFSGVDPKVYYFDHARFFIQEKSADARFEYAMKCVLGELYDKNAKDIKALEDERGGYGKNAKELLARLRDSEITADNYSLLEEQYKEPQTLDEAKIKRDEILDRRPKVQELMAELQSIKDENARYIQTQQTLKYLKDNRLPQLERQLIEATALGNVIESFLPENAISLLSGDGPFKGGVWQAEDGHPFAAAMHRTLFEDIAKLGSDLGEINGHLSMLNNDVAIVSENISKFENELDESVLDEALELELSGKVDKADVSIKELEAEAQLVYDTYVKEVEIFNMCRYKYLQNKVDYDQLQITQGKWKEKDEAIKVIKASNIAAFKEYAILDQIEIREIVTEKKDKENEGEMIRNVQHHLYYNDLELNYDNVSMGESFGIAMLFQTVHNPRFKTIFFQDAQSLGSDFKAVSKAAEENGFQWIAAFTKEDTPLTFKFKERTL